MRLPEWVLREIANLPEQFTGNIKVNCFMGGIANITYERSIKAPPERTNEAVMTR